MTGRIRHRRRLVLAGDIIMLLFSGLVYSWSLFVTPLEADLGFSRSETSLTFTFCSISNTLMALLSAILARKIGSKRVTQLFAILACIGFIGASRTESLWQIYFFYGILCGGAMGAVYNQALTTIIAWFCDKASLMTGILLMCYGMGSVLLSPFISFLISHFNWRATFFILSVMAFSILMFGSFQTRLPTPEEAALLPPPDQAAGSKKSEGMQKDYLPKDMIRTKSFWCFVMWNLSIGVIGLTMSSHAAPIAQSIGVTAAASAFFVSGYSLCNGLGRVGFGVLFDRLGRKKCTAAVSLTGILSGLLLFFSYLSATPALLLPAFLMLGLTFGGGPVCSASIVKELFGEKNYGVNLGFGNLAVLGSAFLGPYAAGFVYQSWGYLAVAVFLALAAALSLCFAVMLAVSRQV